MKYNARFKHPETFKMVLRDSYREHTYYGLDEFDCKYLRIVQNKFGCQNSFHTIPDRVKMEMSPFEWNEKRQEFVLNENKRVIVQLNQLEAMVVSHTLQY